MNGGQMEQLNYKAHTYSSKKYVMYQGQEVAFIKRMSWSMKQEYDITIAQVRTQVTAFMKTALDILTI